MRVLVVEDEPLVGGLLHDSLTHLGHQPHLVPSAEDALTRLATERPDVIFLDVNLPGISGTDFLQLRPIREYGVPIVAMSGVANEQDVEDCLRHGAVDFMAKPITLDRLRRVLTQVEDQAAAEPRPGRAPDRRRAPRVPVKITVTILEDGGGAWQGTSVDLSVFGIKVRAEAPPAIGSPVTLAFTPPDGGPPIRSRALGLRHPDGYAFYFVNLPEASIRRLEKFVKERLAGGAPGPSG